MRAKLVNEAIKHLGPRPKEEVESAISDEVKEKLAYLERILGKPLTYDFSKINFGSEMFGSSNFLKDYVKEVAWELNKKIKKGPIEFTRDWNVGDYWVLGFKKDKDHPKDEDGDFCQLGFNLEMEDWEPDDRLNSCGFGAATGDGAEIFNGLTLNQFAQRLNDYFETGELE